MSHWFEYFPGHHMWSQGIPSRYDYEVPGRAAYEYLSRRPEIDPKRIGVMGFSMGGYYVPRAAAMEPRFAACLAWGGHWDYHESWVRRRRVMEDKTLKVLTAAEGGSEHCQEDNRQVGSNLVADWLAERLGGRLG